MDQIWNRVKSIKKMANYKLAIKNKLDKGGIKQKICITNYIDPASIEKFKINLNIFNFVKALTFALH